MLQQKFCHSKTTENYKKNTRQRNKVNNLINRAKQNYNKNLLDKNTKNATSFWRTLKGLFPTKPKSNLTSTTFKVSKEQIPNKEPIANGFDQLHIKDFVWNKPKNLLTQTTQKFSFLMVTLSWC